MFRDSKGQISSEFFISFSLMLVVVSVFITTVVFLGDFNKSDFELSVEVIQGFVVNEFELASRSPAFFESSFSLPSSLAGFDYEMCIAHGSSSDVLFVSSCDNGGAVSALSLGVDVSGNVSSGSDIVVRNFGSGVEVLCSTSLGGECSFVSSCDADSLASCE